MGAEYLSYMKSIETHARAFLALIILPIGTVWSLLRKMRFAQIQSIAFKSTSKVVTTQLILWPFLQKSCF